jgi:hypothetical protein
MKRRTDPVKAWAGCRHIAAAARTPERPDLAHIQWKTEPTLF